MNAEDSIPYYGVVEGCDLGVKSVYHHLGRPDSHAAPTEGADAHGEGNRDGNCVRHLDDDWV